MARSKRNTGVRESNVSSSMVVWLAFGGIILIMSFMVYLFGFDMGIYKVEGHLGVEGLLVGAGLSLLGSWWVDVKYINVAARFFNTKPPMYSYIPFVGMIALFDKWGLYVSLSALGVAASVSLITFTPLGQYMPVSVIQTGFYKMATVISVCIIIFMVVRGIYCSLIKKDVSAAYDRYISIGYGSGKSLSYVSYISYYIPIVRIVALSSDMNFIKNVTLELESMDAREE